MTLIEYLQSVVLSVEAEYVFALLEQEHLHVTQRLLQLTDFLLALALLPLYLVLLLVCGLVLLQLLRHRLVFSIKLRNFLPIVLEQLS